jgi:hypothetical protein
VEHLEINALNDLPATPALSRIQQNNFIAKILKKKKNNEMYAPSKKEVSAYTLL